MNCYLCKSNEFHKREGRVRDNPKIKICECKKCGLVALNSTSHISNSFYEESGMHGKKLISIEQWLKETSQDDERRFKMLKNNIINKKVLDFGCGAGGFLVNAKKVADKVVGVELETRVRKYWSERLDIRPSLSLLNSCSFNIITAFHVFEHLVDPREILKTLAQKLAKDGRLSSEFR